MHVCKVEWRADLPGVYTQAAQRVFMRGEGALQRKDANYWLTDVRLADAGVHLAAP